MVGQLDCSEKIVGKTSELDVHAICEIRPMCADINAYVKMEKKNMYENIVKNYMLYRDHLYRLSKIKYSKVLKIR